MILLLALLAQPVASGLDDLDSNRIPDSWFVRSSSTKRFEVLANGEVRFNSSAGSAGQCLLSNGSSSPPSWGSCAGGAGGYTGISDEGSGLTSRATLNFTGAGVSCVDNAGSTRTDCTIAGGAGAAYATCQEEGTPLTQRATFNFVGAALTAADNAGATRTDVTLSQSPASTSVVGTGRTLTAGNGLTGGGDLTADRTFDIAVTAPITITGDSVALDSTAVLDNQARVMVRRNTGGNVGARRRLNFIEGTNISITPVDAPATEEVNITIAASGLGGTAGTTDNALVRADGTGGSAAQGSGVIVDDSARLTLPAAATPSAPSAGNAAVYVRSFAGRPLPSTLAPLGAESWLQPSLATNNVAMWFPGVTTTAGINFGVSWTVIATQAHPAQASTNFLTALRRATYSTSTTIGNGSGVLAAANTFWRGNAAGLGGFFFFARVGVVTFQSAMQIAVCLLPTAALGGEPSAVNNHICLRKDSTDANWFFSTRNGTTATPVDLGLAVAANQVLDLYVWAGPNASDITYRVERIDSASVLADNVTTSSTLPVSTTFLAPSAQVRTTTANAVAIALAKIYVESNY